MNFVNNEDDIYKPQCHDCLSAYCNYREQTTAGKKSRSQEFIKFCEFTKLISELTNSNCFKFVCVAIPVFRKNLLFSLFGVCLLYNYLNSRE